MLAFSIFFVSLFADIWINESFDVLNESCLYNKLHKPLVLS